MSRKPDRIRHVVLICDGKDCQRAGSRDIRRSVKKAVKAEGARDRVHVVRTSCNDFCKRAPIVSVQPENRWLTRTSPDETLAVLDELGVLRVRQKA